MKSSQKRFENPYFQNNPKMNLANIWKWLIRSDVWVYSVLIILLLVGTGYVFNKQHWMQVDYITLVGYKHLTADELVNPAREALSDRKWLVLSQRWYPFTDTEYIEEYIRTALAETVALEDVMVTKDFPDTIVVSVRERLPGLVYINTNDQYHYLDLSGVVTERLQSSNNVNPFFPRVRDYNVRSSDVNQTVFRQSLVDTITMLDKNFTNTVDIDIAEYAVEEITCYQKEYVEEKIFADEIESSSNEVIRNEKKDILARLEEGDISIDQSLSLLEETKRTELGDDAEDALLEGNQAYLQIETEYIDGDCNYVETIRDITVVTQDGPKVYFDTELNLEVQLENLQTVLRQQLNDRDLSEIEYIDLRFPDRVYYK